ncbi:MAG: hypothetical protein AABX01_03210 [Candidatus Micrarchaeota archaeon]
MKKVRKNQNRKFIVNASENDLNNLEDLLLTIPTCIKHRRFDDKKFTEREQMTMYYVCKDCNKIKDAHNRSLSKIWLQLCKQCYY